MCNSRPGYRGGWALALQADGESVPNDRVLGLDRDEAVALGRRVIDNETGLCDEFVEAFVASLDGEITEFREREDDARLDFAHGVIIDLRNMYFETERFRHRVRLCITVCQHGKKSKIWFRAECIEIQVDGEWRAPIGLAEKNLQEYFDEAERMAEAGLLVLQNAYQRRVQDYVDDTEPGKVVELHLAEQFEFKVFDSDNDYLPKLFFDLKTGHSFTDWVSNLLKKDPKHAETAIVTMNIAIPDDLPPIDTLKSMREIGGVSIVDHASIDGELGVFIKRSSARPSSNTKRSSYVGAAYDPDSRSPNKKFGQSPAFRISAEMLARVTSNL